jgi:hypothetical protein
MYSSWHPNLTNRNKSKRAKLQPNNNLSCYKGVLNNYAPFQIIRTPQIVEQNVNDSQSDACFELEDKNHATESEPIDIGETSQLNGSLEFYQLNFDESSDEEADNYSDKVENYEMVDYASGILALFYSINSTQSALKSICELIKIVCPGIPSDFNKCASILSNHLNMSYNYERKVYCNMCKIYYEFNKSSTYCKTCNRR